MAVKTKTQLKDFFKTGEKPSQGEFEDLIDSFVHVDGSDGGGIQGDLHVDGNIIPSTPEGSLTSSFSLGSPTAAWKDLFVSEDSIKFIKKSGSGESEELARITIDTGSGKMQFIGLTDHKDLELRQTQFGKSNVKGATINDGGGPSSIDVRFSMQSKETGINGGAFVLRPEFTDLAYLGKDFVRNAFTFKGTGSAAMVLNATPGGGGIRGDAEFKVEAHSEFPSLATQLFTVNELKKYKFHGSDGVLTVEGKVSGSNVTVDNTLAVEGNITASNASFTNGNVVIEEAVVVQPGIISQSITIGTPTSPSLNSMNGVGDNYQIVIEEGVTVKVNDGSTFQVQNVQPTIVANSSEGTITLSDPGIDGGGDIVINPNNNGNPSIIIQNTTIPANQMSYWTVGSGIPGTFISPLASQQNLTSETGIQIGAQMGVIYDGIYIDGEEISPSYDIEVNNVKLRIEDGACLYIQNAQPDLTVDTETDEITLNNTGENDQVTFSTGQFGTNPQYIPNHLLVPSNQIAIWYGPIYVGRFTLNPFGTEFDADGEGVFNMDLASQGDNASLRIQNGAQIKVQAF